MFRRLSEQRVQAVAEGRVRLAQLGTLTAEARAGGRAVVGMVAVVADPAVDEVLLLLPLDSPATVQEQPAV